MSHARASGSEKAQTLRGNTVFPVEESGVSSEFFIYFSRNIMTSENTSVRPVLASNYKKRLNGDHKGVYRIVLLKQRGDEWFALCLASSTTFLEKIDQVFRDKDITRDQFVKAYGKKQKLDESAL